MLISRHIQGKSRENMKKYFIILTAILLVVGGAGFLLWAQIGVDRTDYPDAKEYAPSFWFDSEENYYPTSPLDFYYDENLNEVAGVEARQKYDNLTEDGKLENFKIYYNIDDSGNELVYQYWLFYIFNDAKNEHYGDWESVFAFTDVESGRVNKVVGSFHQGGAANIEIDGSKIKGFDHAWNYVGRGSHANCPDYEDDGYCNSIIWKAWEDWSSDDKLHGLRVEHDSPYYDLRPIEEIKDVFGKKYGEDRPLITKEKSPSLGMLTFKIGKNRMHALPFGGDPPSNAWNKKQFVDSREVLPLTPTRLASNIGGFFNNAGSFFAAVGKVVAGPFAGLFGGDDPSASSGQADSLSELTVESGNLASVGETAAPIVAPAPLPAPTPAPSPVPVSVPIPVPDADPVPTDEGVDDSAPVEESEVEQAPVIEDTAPEPIGKKFDLPSPRRAPIPPLVSIQNNTTFNAASDTNSEEEGNQIILFGTSEPALITIKINPTYTAITTQGIWSTEVTLLYEGENNFTITAANYVGEGRPTNLLINLDSIAPTSTIAVTDYKIDETEFKINWSTDATDLDYYEVEYKIGNASAWQDWGSATTTETDKDYKDATSNTYYFRVRGTDIHQNIGEWQESPGVVIDLTSPIVINEIQLSDAEFVELYNPSSNQIDLEGYYFSYYPSTRITWNGMSTPNGPSRNKAFPEDAKIPAGGYFLIGLDGYPTTGGNPNADWQVYPSKQLNKSKGTVAIFPFNPKTATSSQYAYDNRIDAVGWDNDFDGDSNDISLYEQSPATTTPVDGESLTRDSSHADTENNSADFTVATFTTPTNSAGETYDPNYSTVPVWAMYQKDARHSGLATLSGPTWTNSSQATTTWVFQMETGGGNSQNTGGRSQPVIDNEFVGVVKVATVKLAELFSVSAWLLSRVSDSPSTGVVVAGDCS